MAKLKSIFKKVELIFFLFIPLLICLLQGCTNEKGYVLQSEKQAKESWEDKYPSIIIPTMDIDGFRDFRSNFMVFRDSKNKRTRFSIHRLEGAHTRKNANTEDRQELNNTALANRNNFITETPYQIGQLVPEEDFVCCPDDIIHTHDEINLVLMDSVLKKHAWRELEIKIREWARRRENLYVITGPIYNPNVPLDKEAKMENIPVGFFKVVFILAPQSIIPKHAIAFILPNKAIKHYTKIRNQKTIREIENKTGIDFFRMLPDDLENEIEEAKEDW